MSSTRPNTRSRAFSASTDNDPPAVVQVLAVPPTSQSSHVPSSGVSSSNRRNRRSTAASVTAFKSLIEQKIAITGASVSEQFSKTIESLVNEYLQRLLRILKIISLHRVGLHDNGAREGSPVWKSELEKWLLHKEDCAEYFFKKNAESNTAEPPAVTLPPPLFNDEEYEAHAFEEEQKLVLTLQSVRRISLRDLLPVLLIDVSKSEIKCPTRIRQKIINKIAFDEICSDYRARTQTA